MPTEYQKRNDSIKFIVSNGFGGNWKRPYLRPMSSMAEEEQQVLRSMELKVDFYNQHHLDYRGLIEKGLAIEVTEENNPYKE